MLLFHAMSHRLLCSAGVFPNNIIDDDTTKNNNNNTNMALRLARQLKYQSVRAKETEVLTQSVELDGCACVRINTIMSMCACIPFQHLHLLSKQF